ncbi:centromere protein J [Melitaea cinxia]|uniref:centromere protein J n=1 Tax=Melitaea cinxia TaxID=113334 RepID=UPI001E270261|nr:centromere protein J [Melitaea cinxia]
MDQSYSESDVSISPSQILDRLQVLRQLQILQRGKLQKHRLHYENSPEISSSLTEIVSHFSNSTSYNTFRSLLQSTQESHDVSPYKNTNNLSEKDNLQNVIEGVSVLNLSDESEFIANSVSSRNSSSPRVDPNTEKCPEELEHNPSKKQISLDDMPILSPKKDFETLIAEKLKNEKCVTKAVNTVPHAKKNVKKPFLRRGEGMARFGLQKNDLVIQNTKSLPWKRNKSTTNNVSTTASTVTTKPKIKIAKTRVDKIPIQILEKDTQSKDLALNKCVALNKRSPTNSHEKVTLKVGTCRAEEITKVTPKNKETENSVNISNNNSSSINTLESSSNLLQINKHQSTSKGNTWASVFTKEQGDFLRQLKQSEYYKNFTSPAKSTVSDVSCNEENSKLSQEKEMAEQNLFELIENKVMHESFNINNSFFNRFLKKANMECSGESTPLVMQKCLYKNPNLMHILPLDSRKRSDTTCSESETYTSECTDCIENCSMVSSCSCQTKQGNVSVTCVEEENDKKCGNAKGQPKLAKENTKEKDESHNDTLTAENEMIKSNMAEMNAKLIATSELLKDRLRELEDEIETFRKENINLTKMREEVDMERQKLYEEKNAFEQKFNEEKILSEYHLAEEKEKLNKLKQMYEKYVREMRGRLSKKEKDEVVNLKKEIHDLKEEIKLKDAKSTSIIARLRNQIKIIEKDKKNLEDEVEKLKKENRRIQHSNEITRRVTNIKYLEEINKKLSNMTSKDSRSNVELDSNIKYKAFEIERQSRVRKSQAVPKRKLIQRAKSVPNLHVTSRYAKYFSQKDSISDREKNKTLYNDTECNLVSYAEDVLSNGSKSPLNNSELSNNNSDSEEDNSLEKIYNERFKSISPGASSSKTVQTENLNKLSGGSSEHIIEKTSRKSSQKSLDKSSTSDMLYNSYSRNSKSPAVPYSNRSSHDSKSPSNFFTENRNHSPHNDIDIRHRNKSPVSSLSNHSSSSHKLGTVINNVYCERLIPSPEPTSSKSSLSKTNLNPTEIKKPDGTRELRFPNGNVKIISADGKYSKFVYYNGDIKENFYNEGRVKYFYAETKTYHTTHPDGLEVLEFPDGQVEKRYKDGSSEIKLPNGSIRYFDPKNEHVREEWRFPDGSFLTVSANGEQRIVFANGQVEVHAEDHKRREFPDGSVKLIYNDGTAETRYASGRIRIKDKHGNLIMDSAPG